MFKFLTNIIKSDINIQDLSNKIQFSVVPHFYLCSCPCFGLILVEIVSEIFMLNASKRSFSKLFLIVLYINFFLKAFYLIYMAIFSHHDFRLRTPEFLQSFDKCDNLCYKYIKYTHIFEYWHSFFSILSKVWVAFILFVLL